MSSIILLDDDEQLSSLFALTLESAGHTVMTATNSEHVVDLIAENQAALLITDLVMPEHEGMEGIFAVLRTFRIPIIAMSSYREYLNIVEPIVAAVLQKPLQTQTLVETVEQVLRTPR